MQELLKATREDRAKYFHEATARSENIKNVIIIKPLLTEEFRKNFSAYFDDTEWQLETDEEDE